MKKILPSSFKEKLFCSYTSKSSEVNVLTKKKYVSLNSFLLKLPKSRQRALNKQLLKKKAKLKCESIFKKNAITITPSPTPIASPTPTIALPTFKIVTYNTSPVPKLIKVSTSDEISIQATVACVNCDEDFTLTTIDTESSIIESTRLTVSSMNSNLEKNLELVTQIKPLVIGLDYVSFAAVYQGVTYPVSGAIPVEIQSDSESYPNGIFVSSLSGVDDPTRTGSSSYPYKTVEYAVSRAMTRLSQSSGSGLNVVILLSDGVHLVDSQIAINQYTIKTNDSLKIIPWDNAKPIIFLGRELPKNIWNKDTQGRWQACFDSALTENSNFETLTLYRNTEPLVPARFPNSGMLEVTPITLPDSSIDKINFSFLSSGMPSVGSNRSMNVSFVDQYIAYKTAVRVTGSTATLTNSQFYGKFYSRAGERHEFFLDGLPEFIDGVVTAPSGDTAYEYALNGNCILHNHANFDPAVDTMRYALQNHSGLFRIWNGNSNSGSITIQGIQLSGGALAKEYSSIGPNWGNPVTNHSLIALESGFRINLQENLFGPTGMAGIIGYRDINDLTIANNTFSQYTGPAISIVGRDFRANPTAEQISIKENSFIHPHQGTISVRGVNLGYIGDSEVKNNYFSKLYQSSISVAGLRYYYLGLTWCQRVECPRLLNKSSCSTDEQSRVCSCDPTTPGNSCINNGSNVRKISWEDAQEFNPTRNVLIKGNLIEDGLAPFNDSGLVYIWGIPYGDSVTSEACLFDPEGCKKTFNVKVVENMTINSRATTGANHFVHYYLDDGANSVLLANNVAISPEGSSILVFAKGRGSTIKENLLISNDKTEHAILDFAEFNATSNINAAPFLTNNKEYNREITVESNAFIQFPSSKPNPVERGSIFFFSNWDPSPSDAFGTVLTKSDSNIFSETIYGKTRKAVLLRPLPSSPLADQLFLTVNSWKNYLFSNSRMFDQNSLSISATLPSKAELLNGLMPSDPALDQILSNLPKSVGKIENSDRYPNYTPSRSAMPLGVNVNRY